MAMGRTLLTGPIDVADLSKPKITGVRKVGGDGDPEVFVTDEQSDVEIDIRRWQALAEAVLGAEGIRGGTELSIMYIGETEMTELNEAHMGVNAPTDVLSFPIDAEDVEVVSGPNSLSRGPDRSPVDTGDLPLLLGDIVICPAVAERQFIDHAGTLDDELALLLVHGILHILGHDHVEPQETAKMRARELELLTTLHWHGVAPAAFRQQHDDDNADVDDDTAADAGEAIGSTEREQTS
jgi:probable rRNA maturation factor